MRRLTRVMLMSVMALLLCAGQALYAQTTALPITGHAVLVAVELLPVYERPDPTSAMVSVLFKGQETTLTVNENGWLYLRNDAFGWVPATIADTPTVVEYAPETIEQMALEADAAIAANPTDPYAYVRRYIVHRTRYEYDLALADINEALTINGLDGLLYGLRGRLYNLLGDYDLAQIDLEQAESLGGITANQYATWGIAYELRNNITMSKQILQQGIDAYPNYGLLYANLSIQFLNTGASEDAIFYAEEALTRDPYHATAYEVLGGVYKRRSGNDALAYYNLGIEQIPADSQLYVRRGNYYLNDLYDYEAALADFNQAIAINPREDDAYQALAFYYMNSGDTTQALTYFELDAAVDPSDVNANNNLGTFYAQSGNYEQALVAYTRAIQSPQVCECTSAYLWRSQVNFALGNEDAAFADAEAFVATNEGSRILDINALMIQGLVRLHQDEYAEGANYIMTALLLDQDYTLYSYHNDGRIVTDRLAVLEAVDMQTRTANATAADYRKFGHLLLEYGQWSDAMLAYEKALALEDNAALRNFVEQLRHYVG